MQLTTLTFNIPLHPGDITVFRASIAELAGFEHSIFHNHDATDGADHHIWDYPQIQYGVRRGRAAIIGIGRGAAAIQQHLLPKLAGTLTFGGRSYPIDGFDLKVRQAPMQWVEPTKLYGLAGWLALNKENYLAWKEMNQAEDRKLVLNRALTGQLRALAQGLGLPDHKQAVGEVLTVDNQKRIEWHQTHLVRFDTVIRCNLDLPPGIGLGRAAAFGFGELMSARNYEIYRSRKTSYSAKAGQQL